MWWEGLFHVSLVSTLFVLSLYVWRFFPGVPLPRNHPKSILQRMTSVLLACMISAVYLSFVLPDPSNVPEVFGLRREKMLIAYAAGLGVTAVLFLGPLVQMSIDPGSAFDGQTRLMMLRNIVVAPIAEEFVFRALNSAVLVQMTPLSPWSVIVVTSLIFGLAHVHHIIENTLIQVIVMFLYTSLFGFYSAVVYLCTGHLFAAILAHAFCNAMGLPDFGALFTHPRRNLLRISFVTGLAAFIAFLSTGAFAPSNYNSQFF